MKYSCLIMCLICLIKLANSTILFYPGEYPTLQTTVNASQDADTILISRWLYYEQVNVTNRNLTIARMFLLTSDTIDRDSTLFVLHDTIATQIGIDRSVFRIRNSDIKIIGLSFKNGRGSIYNTDINPRYLGGGLLIDSSTVELRVCKITHCTAVRGGGVAIIGGVTRLIHCIIDSSNYIDTLNLHLSNQCGGGLYVYQADSISIISSLLINNRTNGFGAGCYIEGSYGILENSIFRNNRSLGGIGGGAMLISMPNSIGFHRIEGNTFENNYAQSSVGLFNTNINRFFTTTLSFS